MIVQTGESVYCENKHLLDTFMHVRAVMKQFRVVVGGGGGTRENSDVTPIESG